MSINNINPIYFYVTGKVLLLANLLGFVFRPGAIYFYITLIAGMLLYWLGWRNSKLTKKYILRKIFIYHGKTYFCFFISGYIFMLCLIIESQTKSSIPTLLAIIPCICLFWRGFDFNSFQVKLIRMHRLSQK